MLDTLITLVYFLSVLWTCSPWHTGRESCALQSCHSQNPGVEEGMAPYREDTCCPCSPHIFPFSPAQTTASCGFLHTGCTESCCQASGLSFSSNRHDSVTLLDLWTFFVYDHPPLVSLRKLSLILITRSQAEGTRGLGLELGSGSGDSFTSDLGQASPTLHTFVFPLPVSTEPSSFLCQCNLQ